MMKALPSYKAIGSTINSSLTFKDKVWCIKVVLDEVHFCDWVERMIVESSLKRMYLKWIRNAGNEYLNCGQNFRVLMFCLVDLSSRH